MSGPRLVDLSRPADAFSALSFIAETNQSHCRFHKPFQRKEDLPVFRNTASLIC